MNLPKVNETKKDGPEQKKEVKLSDRDLRYLLGTRRQWESVLIQKHGKANYPSPKTWKNALIVWKLEFY